MDQYQQLFVNNKRWVERKTKEDRHYFEKLSTEQNPDYLYIGCSDSRVPANEIMGLEPGEVFVHRNIANLVVNTDLNIHSVIEYAVVHLDVKHIIVCGHYGCGGVKAAMMSKDLGLLNPWLRNIRDVYRIHQEELDNISGQMECYNRLIELNIQEQCINVIKVASVQKSFLAKGYPRVHGWVYDLHNGYLKDLEIDFEAVLGKIRKIYNLLG